jgi:alkanesulfonate monooxygenase SsuD/methylene tetrahydromethanopterin reductase-like flavin-dependent oxidoreductase (luciferase family)
VNQPAAATARLAKEAERCASASDSRIRSSGRTRLRSRTSAGRHAEFEALGADFHSRGERTAEQVVVLRRLWTEPLVTFTGHRHTLDRVAIAPLPARPIPLWMGGGTGEVPLRRIARLASAPGSGTSGPSRSSASWNSSSATEAGPACLPGRRPPA